MNTQIIAIANQKGGVGKTTTCANLGIGLAQAGKKVLLIDGTRKGSTRLAAGMTTNMIANMSKEESHISMDIGPYLRKRWCEVTDVIELVPDEPASTGGKEHERIKTKNNGKRN